MAKRKVTTRGLFDQTAPAEAAGKLQDPNQARGVGLRASEWQYIDERARALGWNPHRLTVALLRYGLKALQDGKIKTKQQETLDL